MLALLNSNEFPELDRRFSALQRDYKNGALTDESLRAAFRVFYATDGALELKYDAWCEPGRRRLVGQSRLRLHANREDA